MMAILLRNQIRFGAWSLRLAVTLRHFARANSLEATKGAQMVNTAQLRLNSNGIIF
jgi:hypothetical protein